MSSTGEASATKIVSLPILRADLELLPGACNVHGEPTWLIHDPVMNRFTQIEPAAREALRHWPECRTVEELVERVNAAGRVRLDAPSVMTLVDFLYASQLTEAPKSGGWRSFARTRSAQTHSLPAWLVHNYLFFRIPLFRPQSMLERSLPFVRLLWSRLAVASIAAMGLAGLYLVSRQWERYSSELLSYLSWDGILSATTALAVVKLAHELGHAYAAAAFGCRVHSMGIAFVVMAPLPYTDVTDAWRLTDRRQRLIIDGAGMLAELAIAAVALFLWSFLPDGPARNAVFVLSAVSIISSLVINLNPFMRFDGYYLMSELLRVENLQPRAFAIGRWRLREALFGLGLPAPEPMSAQRLFLLTLYAWSTWIYRVILFVGIALIVYHYFFKVLGLVLFAVEIIFFIARPIAGELSLWWRMRSKLFATRRTKLTLAIAAAGVLAVLLPWSSTIEVPAVLEAAELQAIYPTRSARVSSVLVKHGDNVRSGDVIATLVATDIEDELRRTRISLQMAELQHGRRVADATDREQSFVIESTIAALRSKIEGLLQEQKDLVVRAPFDGRIVDLNPELSIGRWISPRELIAVVAGGEGLVARGYVAESDLARITEGASAVFIPDHPSRSRVDLRVVKIATAGATQIEIADLASVNTGRIAVTLDERRRLVPSASHYLVTMRADGATAAGDLAVRGIALADGRAESFVSRVWRRALGVLIRESGA